MRPETLKPCPFCGCPDIRTPTVHWGAGGPIPRCSGCLAEAPDAAAWNRRAIDPAAASMLSACKAAHYAMERLGHSAADATRSGTALEMLENAIAAGDALGLHSKDAAGAATPANQEDADDA